MNVCREECHLSMVFNEALAAGDSACAKRTAAPVSAIHLRSRRRLAARLARQRCGRRSCPHRHRIRTGLFEPKFPLREMGFSGQRQRGRNGSGDSRTPVQRPNLARQLRQFGANRGVPGNRTSNQAVMNTLTSPKNSVVIAVFAGRRGLAAATYYLSFAVLTRCSKRRRPDR
jgi:hypothetical protein